MRGHRDPGRRLPVAVLAVATVGIVAVALPIVGLLQRAPWSSLIERLGTGSTRDALRLSVLTATAAAIAATAIGAPMGLVFARGRSRLVRWARAVALTPLVLPPVVAGVALLATFGRRGLFGGVLDAAGARLPFTPAGVVVAQTFVAIPFVVLAVEAGARGIDPALEEAAAACGGSRWFRFRHVTAPLLAPSVAASLVLAWGRALGEFGATITFAGNVAEETRTLPLAVVTALQADADAAIALSVVLVALSVAVLIGLRDRWLGGAR